MPPKNSVTSRLFTSSRLLVVAGKGGVGKTTVTAVLATAAADAGLRVLVVAIDTRPGLAALLGGGPSQGSTYEGDLIATNCGKSRKGSIHLRTLSAGEALQDYLATQGLARIAKRLVSTGVVDVVASAAPGIDDLLVLGKVKHLVGLAGPGGPHDLVIVDGPAAGHAISLMRSPAAMASTIRGGPLRTQAIEIDTMLRDASRSRVVLVTIPESTPVNELIETARLLRDDVGVALAPVVVNGVDRAEEVERLVASGRAPTDHLGEAARFRAVRSAIHRRELARIGGLGLGSPVELPHVATARLSARDVRRLATALESQVDS